MEQQLPKSLVIACDYVLKEVTRLMNDAKNKPMTRQDWDKVNRLLGLFAADIAVEIEMEVERKCIR